MTALPSPELRPRSRSQIPLFSAREWRRLADELGLSRRGSEIVQRIFRDETEFAIAADLHISPHTVHTHLERLYRRLGVSSRVGLVLRVVSQHLGRA